MWYDKLCMKGQGVSVAQMEPTDIHGLSVWRLAKRRSDDNPKEPKASKYEYEIRIYASPMQTHQGRG